ncbi:MAG: NlpC/P60 family protein [Vagococcus sp.]
MKKKILSTLLISSLMLSATALPLVVSADTVDSKIESQDKKIADLKSKEATASSALASIQGNIASIKEEASALQTKQGELNKQIGSLNEEVKDLEARIEKRDASIKEQARSVQVESNNSNVVDLVLTSDSVSDAVTKVMAASKLVNANNDMMKQQKEDKQAVEDKKSETEDKIAEVQETAVVLEQKKGELIDQELAQQAAVSEISAEKETEQGKKDKFLAEKAEAEAQREAAKKAAEAAVKQAEKEPVNTVDNSGTTTNNDGGGQTTPPVENNTDNNGNGGGQTTPPVDNGNGGGQTTPPVDNGNGGGGGQEVAPPAPGDASAVVAEAYKHIGKPYVWGAKGPDSFDCSGFTSYVYRVAQGREIGGWTVPQEGAGAKISLSQLAPGDLVFWGAPGSTHHVGIYVGGGQYIHAPQPGQNVCVQSISAWSPDFGVRM